MEVLEPKLKVEHLCKSYEGKTVLEDICFEVRNGEFLSILGASGCGKTTLVRILIGLERADSGLILKNGKDISGLTSFGRGMGIVFQNYALFPDMTVLDNVSYALKVHGMKKKEAQAKAASILDQIGMSDQVGKKPAQLSGGQQQRVAIARTLALNPDIILLDEPISALDVENREIMKAELKNIQRKFQATMIFITHDQEEAFFLSDRIMVMSVARIEQLDTPKVIYHEPASEYVRKFVVEMMDKKYESIRSYMGLNENEK